MLAARDAFFLVGGRVARKACPAAPLNPENTVPVLRFERKAKLHLNFLRAANEAEKFFRFLLQAFKLPSQPGERLIQSSVLVSILLEEFTPSLKCETPLP